VKKIENKDEIIIEHYTVPALAEEDSWEPKEAQCIRLGVPSDPPRGGGGFDTNVNPNE